MCPGRPESAAPVADGAPDGAAIEVGETAVFKALRKGTTWAFKVPCAFPSTRNIRTATPASPAERSSVVHALGRVSAQDTHLSVHLSVYSS